MANMTPTQARAILLEELAVEAIQRPDVPEELRQNPLRVLLANSFSAEHLYQESEGAAAISSATLATLLTISVPAAFPGGLVRCDWHVLAEVSALTALIRVRVDLDASSPTSADGTVLVDTVITSAGPINQPANPICGFRVGDLPAGAHTIRLKVAKPSGAGTVTFTRNRLAAVQVA